MRGEGGEETAAPQNRREGPERSNRRGEGVPETPRMPERMPRREDAGNDAEAKEDDAVDAEDDVVDARDRKWRKIDDGGTARQQTLETPEDRRAPVAPEH